MKKILETKIKDMKAITLIALIVTIIILLILAGVTVGLATNGTGLFEKAKLATNEYNNSVEKENTEIGKVSNEIDSIISTRTESDSIQMQSPKLLCTAILPSTSANARAAGTYNASSSSYQKTNQPIFDDYLSFEEDVGWKVKKSGWYFFYGNFTVNANSVTLDASLSLYINDLNVGYTSTRAHKGYLERNMLNYPLFLEKDDVINMAFAPTESSNWNSSYFYIYTMTK